MLESSIASPRLSKADALDYEVELAYQTGDRRGASEEAWMLAGTAGYSFANVTLSRLAVGYEVLSGTPVGDSKYKSFDPLYHTVYKFYGFMDYFINVPANTGDRGLVNMFARATLSLSDKLTAILWLHQFAQAQSVGGESALGQEIDVVALYRHNKSVSFELGVSTFVPAYLMRERFKSPGVNAADASFWGYLTTMVSF